MPADPSIGSKPNPDIDSPKAIAAALAMGVLGNLIFMGAPFLVGSLVDTIGYSEQHAGWVFSADMVGLALGSIITSFLVNRSNRRTIAAAGIACLVLGNLASLAFHDLENLIAIRILAGIGSGALYAISVANLSGTQKTARNFSLLLFLILAVGAIEAILLPVFSDLGGVNGIFIAFIISAVVGAPIVFWLAAYPVARPASPEIEECPDNPIIINVPRYLSAVYLLSIVVYTVLIGAVWTYVERTGISVGFEPGTVSRILSFVNLMGIIGALIAAVLSRRWGQGRMLLASLLCVSIVFVSMAATLSPSSYVTGLVIFNVLWVLVNVYQMGTLANLDPTGRAGSLVPFAQDTAAAIGSPIGGALIAGGYGYASIVYFGAACALASFCIFFPAYLKVRTLSPAVADAP